MSEDRLQNLQDLMVRDGVEALAVNASSLLSYLAGLDFHLSERPILLLIPDKGIPNLFFPEFEINKAEQAKIKLGFFPYKENPDFWINPLTSAIEKLNFTKKSIGVPPESMRFLELELLQTAVGHKQIISAEKILKKLLIQKDSTEINAIKKAVVIAENAIESLLFEEFLGKTEKQLANLLVIKLLESGSEPDLPFNPIIASGPNSANPHAIPGDRMIQSGDILIVDWGARFDGYVSDITRTFQVGAGSEEFIEISEVVKRANAMARKKAEIGILASEVDQAARDVISKSDYGEFFTHRTGHGIGLLAHEDPYISESSRTELAPGMVFTVEPGIYIPGKGGVRIEDNILITNEGSSTLTALSRELISVN